MKTDILNDKPSKVFGAYLLPSICSAVFVSVYVITDTVMVGHGVGSVGLTALNILLPLFSVYFAFGYLFGTGGSVLMSVAAGAGDRRRADGIFTLSLIMLFITGAVLTAAGMIFFDPLVYAMGADDESYPLVYEYGRILVPSAFVYMLSPFMQSFVRNDGAPSRAMAGSAVGSLLNVFLDYIFIFPMGMGMTGAITATVIGNITNILITSSHFLSKKNNIHINMKAVDAGAVPKILSSGAAAFFGEFANAAAVLIYNVTILRYLGSEGIVIYSVITNTLIVVNSVLNGVSNAAQPIISYNVGAGRRERGESVYKTGLITAILFAAAMYVFIFIYAKYCIYAFVPADEAPLANGIPALRIYFSGCVFQAVSLFTAAYFQAAVYPARALTVGLMRGLFVCAAMVLLLPMIFGGEAVWFAAPVTEIITAVTAVLLKRKI